MMQLKPSAEQDALVESIVTEIASRKGVEHRDLPPLAETIDTDALQALFQSRPNGQQRPFGKITFSYIGFEVTVSDSEVNIHDVD